MGGTASGSVFSDHERATVEASVARIVPSDQDPGAREAGVVEYIEGLLATDEAAADVGPREKKEYANFVLGGTGGRTEERQAALFQLMESGSRHRQAYRDGVAELDRLARELFSATDFRGLDEARQDRVLDVLDHRDDPFFALLVVHAMEGFYGHPRHGGNRDRAGWKVLGYPGPSFPHGNDPPYGWYDANVQDPFAADGKGKS